MAWSTTSAAILSLRSLLHDGPTDKIAYQKKVIGQIDGTNTIFKTFEARRLTNFTATNAFPLGIYVNGVLKTASYCTQDDPISGTFQVSSAPSQTSRDVIDATYYYQWFLDSDLDGFLQNASTWLGFAGATYNTNPDGLNAATLRFAAQEAYTALSALYSTRFSQVYKLEDAPNEDVLKSVEAFKEMASGYMKEATALRDDYYTRQGQSKQPLFNLAVGSVVDPVPRR